MINGAREYGIIQGYEDDDPSALIIPLPGAPLPASLTVFSGSREVSPANTFSDTAGTYWEDAILKLHASGVYLGNEGKALSSATITRQQAVTMIGRAFQVMPETASRQLCGRRIHCGVCPVLRFGI